MFQYCKITVWVNWDHRMRTLLHWVVLNQEYFALPNNLSIQVYVKLFAVLFVRHTTKFCLQNCEFTINIQYKIISFYVKLFAVLFVRHTTKFCLQNREFLSISSTKSFAYVKISPINLCIRLFFEFSGNSVLVLHYWFSQ